MVISLPPISGWPRLPVHEKKYEKALELLDLALSFNSRSPGALSFRAYLLRKTGKPEDALRQAEMTLHNDPLNHWAASEKYFSNQGKTGAAEWSETDLQDFKFRCGGNVQSVLELALNYGNIGAYEEALQVLSRFSQLKEPESGFPLIFYYQGIFQNKLGNRGAAETSFRQASQANPDYCFPFRIEEINMLKTAIQLQ